MASSGPGLIVPRSIGSIKAHITIREQSRQRGVVTSNPVQVGSPIADHAYVLPAFLSIRAGWSPSTPNASASVITEMFERLSSLICADLIDIVTGKTTWRNMMLIGCDEVTDYKTEFALLVDLEFQKVNLTDTQTLTLAPSFVQAFPSLTQQPQLIAQVQAAKATNAKQPPDPKKG